VGVVKEDPSHFSTFSNFKISSIKIYIFKVLAGRAKILENGSDKFQYAIIVYIKQ